VSLAGGSILRLCAEAPQRLRGPALNRLRAVAARAAPALLALLLAAPAAAQTCTLAAAGGAASPQPEWVTNPGGTADTLFAVGVAELASAGTLEAAREAARSRALTELAQQIQAEVRSRISESIEKVTQDGRVSLSERFATVGEVQSRLALRNVQVDAQWLDAAGCRLWLRVRLPRAEAERARAAATSDAAAATLRERMALAADNGLGAGARSAALAEARELATLADPRLSPGFSRDAFELQAAELEGTLTALRDRDAQYRAQLTRHVQAMAQAGASSAGAARRALLSRALAAIDVAQSLAPAGLPGFAPPFDVNERVAALHAELGAPCAGRLWFERRGLAVPAALAGAADCSAARLAQERRRLYFDGKTVDLECVIALGGKPEPEPWAKACSALQSALSGDGATLARPGTPAEVRISLRAEGRVQERPGSDGSRPAWRFQGQLKSRAQGPAELDIADDYEGLTGWNPVSPQMAADLLALAAVKRLDAALARFWETR